MLAKLDNALKQVCAKLLLIKVNYFFPDLNIWHLRQWKDSNDKYFEEFQNRKINFLALWFEISSKYSPEFACALWKKRQENISFPSLFKYINCFDFLWNLTLLDSFKAFRPRRNLLKRYNNELKISWPKISQF